MSRILWSIHLYPPEHNCGSEYVAHNINKYLISKGHHVRVLLQQANMHKIEVPYMWEGVEVMPPSGQLDAYRWADVICTHLDYTQFTILMADGAKRPLVHFVHNDTPYSSIQNAMRGSHVVYNSEWVKQRLNYKWPSLVVTPPCDCDQYNVCETPEDNEYITLISLNENKGGNILYKIAAAMPEKKFLGVVGSYDHQIIKECSNVTIVPNTPDILSVYRKTRTLIMPSAYESWGRTATEAMCSGIPVVCTETPGLKENCNYAGMYIKDRNNIAEWVRMIRKLDKKEEYKKHSELSRKRAQELKPDLSQLEQFIINAQFYN
jgi:glycosyltransferase involved in cell wall biosynthesis